MTYRFENDWFSHRIPIFERFLGTYNNTRCKFLEIGTHEGRSAVWLLQNILTHDEARLVTIDPFKAASLEHNLSQTGQLHKIEFKSGFSHEVLPQLTPNEFDFAYIDGSHWTCDVLEDAVLSFRKVKTGGIIAFDDYLWRDQRYAQHGTPKPAIDSFLSSYGHKLKLLELGKQVWVSKLSD